MPLFQISADMQPSGDQPDAIEKLVLGLERGERAQTLLGVTGSGKTFTMANVIDLIRLARNCKNQVDIDDIKATVPDELQFADKVIVAAADFLQAVFIKRLDTETDHRHTGRFQLLQVLQGDVARMEFHTDAASDGKIRLQFFNDFRQVVDHQGRCATPEIKAGHPFFAGQVLADEINHHLQIVFWLDYSLLQFFH